MPPLLILCEDGIRCFKNNILLIEGHIESFCMTSQYIIVKSQSELIIFECTNEEDWIYKETISIASISHPTFLRYRKHYTYAFYNNVTHQLHLNKDVFYLSIDESIYFILQQDDIIYMIAKTTLFIVTPDIQVFGKQEIHGIDEIHAPILKGMELLFLERTTHTLYAYHLLYKTKRKVYNAPNPITWWTLTTEGHLWISYLNTIEQRLIETTSHLLNEWSMDMAIKSFVHTVTDVDYQCPDSKIKESFVETFMFDEMDRNQQSIMKILCDVSKEIYTNPDKMNVINQLHHPMHYPFVRDLYKCVYIGNDINNIISPPDTMFQHASNYQHILKDMGSILQPSSKKPNHLSIREIYDFLDKRGIFINPQYVLSGLLHFIWPMHGKGWHHNIESVPKVTCDVVYFVCTDENHFGGSFFFYRHPYTHCIQAVPDIHGTMKFFKLKNDHQSPLWHSIGSFTAHRLSYGLSKKADMGGTP